MLKETFMTNRDINDREVQQLSENVTVLDKDVNALKEAVQQMNETLQNGNYAKTISRQQMAKDCDYINQGMRNALSVLRVTPPSVDLPRDYRERIESAVNAINRMSRPLLPAKPKKWLWRLLLASFCLNLCFGGYVLYQYRWSPYAWGIRAHEAATELNVKGHERAFDYVVSGIRRGNKKERKGLVLDWEREIKKNH